MPVEQQAMPAEQAIASRELMPTDKRLPAESKRKQEKKEKNLSNVLPALSSKKVFHQSSTFFGQQPFYNHRLRMKR